MKIRLRFAMVTKFAFPIIILMMSCAGNEPDVSEVLIDDQAKVIMVDCVGFAFNYTLSVTIESPDTGCEQYADWWEVFTEEEVLIYRRILGHSHVDEQPFTRSGGLVEVDPNTFIYVRAHMNNLGYGTAVFSGTLTNGLVQDSVSLDFASHLETESPLPTDCAF